jgi:hypothetical protein
MFQLSSESKIFFILATIIVISSFVPSSYADRIITYQTVVNVKKESLLSAMSNLQEYNKIFPDNIRYVRLLDNNTHLVEMNAGINGIYFDTQATYTLDKDGKYVIEVTSGDLKGTTMTTMLEKTWGPGGQRDGATKADISLDMKASGLLSWMLNFVPDNSVSFALEDGFYRFVKYAQAQ